MLAHPLKDMGWLSFLNNLSLLVTVGTDVIILCHVVPAFGRTKNKAFLFLAFACLLGIVDSVYDHTLASRVRRLEYDIYVAISTLRRFAYFVDCIAFTTGIVLLLRPYLRDKRE